MLRVRERRGSTYDLKMTTKSTETSDTRARQTAIVINGFGVNLFRQSVYGQADGQIDSGVSPASLIVQLGALSLMSDDQATGAAETAMFGILGPPHLDKIGLELSKLAVHRSSYKWYTSAAFLLPKGCPIRTELGEDLKNKYGLQMRTFNLAQEYGREAVTYLNETVAVMTEQHVQEMVTPDYRVTDEFAQSILASNATYFHPWWYSRFDRNKTDNALFYETAQKERNVQMMHREDMLPYIAGQLTDRVKVRMVGLPCRRNSGTVYFLLPAKRFGMREVINELTGERLSALIAGCHPVSVQLALPKVWLGETLQLRNELLTLGAQPWLNTQLPSISKAVDGNASYSVGQFLHRVVLRINEDGDRCEHQRRSDSSDSDAVVVKFRCDEPFLVVFHHALSNAIWMIACVSRPIYRH